MRVFSYLRQPLIGRELHWRPRWGWPKQSNITIVYKKPFVFCHNCASNIFCFKMGILLCASDTALTYRIRNHFMRIRDLKYLRIRNQGWVFADPMRIQIPKHCLHRSPLRKLQNMAAKEFQCGWNTMQEVLVIFVPVPYLLDNKMYYWSSFSVSKKIAIFFVEYLPIFHIRI